MTTEYLGGCNKFGSWAASIRVGRSRGGIGRGSPRQGLGAGALMEQLTGRQAPAAALEGGASGPALEQQRLRPEKPGWAWSGRLVGTPPGPPSASPVTATLIGSRGRSLGWRRASTRRRWWRREERRRISASMWPISASTSKPAPMLVCQAEVEDEESPKAALLACGDSTAVLALQTRRWLGAGRAKEAGAAWGLGGAEEAVGWLGAARSERRAASRAQGGTVQALAAQIQASGLGAATGEADPGRGSGGGGRTRSRGSRGRQPAGRAGTAVTTRVDALRAIKGSLVDPVNNLENWNRGDPCTSNWTGVFCHKVNDEYLHITELQLFKRNLSGTLAPEVSLLSQLKTLDFMWNSLTGSIPKEIGNITTLKLILLNGNQLSGFLPDEIGNLQNLNRLQVDKNQISGPIPKSFANLKSVKHIHMNNNSLSGQIPSELSRLPLLVHLLVDNNNLSGPLPTELAEAPALKIFQADNNNLSGSSIPTTYSNISKLLKLSLRNCSLQGAIPDLSGIPQLGYLDLSWNQLTGSIPANKLASNITTIDLSHNMLNGTIPLNFSGLPNLQLLSVGNNRLDGAVPSTIWNDIVLTGNRSLLLDFQNNSLQAIPASFNPPPNVTVMLYGNPVCENSNGALITNLCEPQSVSRQTSKQEPGSNLNCGPCPTDTNYEHNPSSPIPCFCAMPLGVGLRLKSPGFTDFRPYEVDFEINLASLLQLFRYQLYIEHYIWEVGPRLNMHLKLFPCNKSSFNMSEVVRLRHVLAGWEITLSDVFGPYELLNFTLGSYADEFSNAASAGLSKAALGGILAGTIAGAIALSSVATILIMRRRSRSNKTVSRRSLSRFSVRIDGVRCFTFEEMATATNNFDLSAQVGQGGYGKVYKGILVDGEIVAIKRAHEDSLQGSREFCTEIELLSRLHHRNLVSLVGYCDEDEQMLVYEFMPNGTLHDHLSAKSKRSLSFGLRLHIALGAAKGILYLHTEASPPVFHRDVKASNILLDFKFVAKVADFGISRLAPVPDVEGTLPDHVSTVVQGTPGYLDPEYFLTHKLTDKSDVYSIGVVFLEMLTGMKPIEHGKNIVREVNKAYKSSNISEIIDSRMGLCPPECIRRFLSLATKCCQDETDARPSMSEIVRELEVILRMMPEVELVLLETPETDSGDMTKSTSTSSATGTFFVSQTSGSGSVDASGGMLSRMVIPQ